MVHRSATNRRSAAASGPRGEFVQSLARGLALLDSLAEMPGGIALIDLCQRVGLSTSTAHRLLTTLEEHRYVRCDPGTRRWSIGVQAFIAGNGFAKARSLVEMARPQMHALMEESGETANLAVLDGVEVVFLAQVECRQMMRALAFPGMRVPPHCSAPGKALLAMLPEPVLAEVLRRRGLPRLTPRTITTLYRLREALEQTRAQGYAVDDQEHALGLRCVAAVVYDENRQPAGAMSLSGPAVRIPDERLAALGELVRRTAASVTETYGGHMPHLTLPSAPHAGGEGGTRREAAGR